MSSSHPISGTGARIDLRAVTKTYRGADQPAVKGIDLTINEGEFMTFLGGSGAGKTTTLNMIAGFESITSGGILLDGKDISRLPPHKRGLGMVFQNYALFPHMSVFDNVAFPLKQRKVERAELRKRVNETLDLVQLGRFSDRLPGQLSGGQQQRVALARAIVFSPRVLLLDEPLGALDKKLRELLQVEISRIHRELGLTFVYVTHDQEEALGMSDRITLFQDGRIAQVGTPSEIYEKPSSRFVATFLGESNIFSGKLRGNVLDTGHGELAVERQPNSGTSVGEVELMVRPEHMTIGETSEPGSNSLKGTVTEVIYQGAFRRVSVEFEVGNRGQVRESATSVHGGIPISVGERISVSWLPERAVLLSTPNSDHLDKALTG